MYTSESFYFYFPRETSQTKNKVGGAQMSLPVPFIEVLKKKENPAEAEPTDKRDRGLE